jgi:hypothetical protein
MSQPCSAVELVLFDARALLDGADAARDALRFVRERGLLTGALADLPDLARRLDAAGIGDALDFWVPGTPGEWPFDRVQALVDVEPGRTLLLSDDPALTALALDLGLRPIPACREELERSLT